MKLYKNKMIKLSRRKLYFVNKMLYNNCDVIKMDKNITFLIKIFLL